VQQSYAVGAARTPVERVNATRRRLLTLHRFVVSPNRPRRASRAIRNLALEYTQVL
jgi:hypothetical protein